MTQCMEKSAFKYTECIFLCENLAVQFILYNHVVPVTLAYCEEHKRRFSNRESGAQEISLDEFLAFQVISS